jgi:hypothetical protein
MTRCELFFWCALFTAGVILFTGADPISKVIFP